MKKRLLFCTEATYLSSGYARYYNALINYLHSTGEFEICELAAWGDNADPRSYNIPWLFVGNMPTGSVIKQAKQQEVEIYESNPYNKFGAFKFEEVCAQFKPDYVCIPPNKLVMTESGYRPIQDIIVGEKVLTHTGKFQKVVKVMRKEYHGQLINIKFNGCSDTLSCTPEHPIYNYVFKKRSTYTRNNKTVYANEKPVFTPAKDVRGGNLILLPLTYKNNKKYIKIKISDYLLQFCSDGEYIYTYPKGVKVKNKITINKDFGKLLGYIIGDGNLGKRSITITFGLGEQHFADDCQQLFKTIFNIDVRFAYSKTENTIVVHCNSTLVVNFFRKYIIHHNIPKDIWSSPKDVLKGVASGLIRSDGCYKKNTVSLTTKYKDLAHNYRQILTILGVRSTIMKSRKKYYDVNVYGMDANDLHDIVNKYEPIKLHHNSKNKSCRIQKINNYLTAVVSRTRTKQYNGQVYNLEVENDNSYIVEQCCVHNCDIRDAWHSQHEISSPFRPFYNLVWMPAVDAEPQQDEWLSWYKQCDAILTYTDWGKKVLDRVSNRSINTVGTASPVCDTVFKPVNDKEEHKKKMGFNPDMNIIGTVMRNQKRKLFPDLFKAFEKYILKNNLNNTYLYCHTSYPDDGWNIPKLLKECSVSNKIVFTYICRNCNNVFPSFFRDGRTFCPKCNAPTAMMTNTNFSVSNEILAAIYNCFDVYVQYAGLEGFGMPVVEAAACGVPVMAVDYSAMSEVARKLNGYLINVQKLHMEMESGRLWAIPDNDHLVSSLEQFFSLSKGERKIKSCVARQQFEENYNNWGIVGKKWYDVIKSLSYNKLSWNSPPRIHIPAPYNQHNNLSHKQFVEWLLIEVLGEPERLGTHMETRLIRDLNFESTNYGMGGMYYNEETSALHNVRMEEFNREKAYKHIVQLCERRNFWEKERLKYVK